MGTTSLRVDRRVGVVQQYTIQTVLLDLLISMELLSTRRIVLRFHITDNENYLSNVEHYASVFSGSAVIYKRKTIMGALLVLAMCISKCLAILELYGIAFKALSIIFQPVTFRPALASTRHN